MMNILIVEDETAAARGLEAMVRKVLPDSRVVAVTDSVEETVGWLGANPAPDLIFMDIHLADGESFRVFDRVEVTSPVIFTTAYDKYALEAFRVNSIDYLLKPIKEEDLRRAVEKLHRLTAAEVRERVGEMKRVFLIPVKDKIIPLRVEEVAFFYTSQERVRAFCFDGRVLPMDRSLDRLSKILSGDDRGGGG